MATDYNWDTPDSDNTELTVTDCNGNVLQNGDSVMAIKDIKVKGGNDIKRWDKFKSIRLTDNIEEIESWKMVLRTEFFKKA